MSRGKLAAGAGESGGACLVDPMRCVGPRQPATAARLRLVHHAAPTKHSVKSALAGAAAAATLATLICGCGSKSGPRLGGGPVHWLAAPYAYEPSRLPDQRVLLRRIRNR